MELFKRPECKSPQPPFVEELRGIDLSQITPLQALLKLNEWKENLADEE
jgi:hypothetical protein